MTESGSQIIGVLPNGLKVHVINGAIAQYGLDTLRYECVDKIWFEQTGSAPGYHRIRTRPFSDDCVWIKAKTHEEALNKYIKSRKD